MSDAKRREAELREALACTPTETKECKICRAVHDPAAWLRLPFAGIQRLPMPDGTEERWELRNCPCGIATLARLLVQST